MKRRVLFQGDSITDTDRSKNEDWMNNTKSVIGLGKGYPSYVSAALSYEHPGEYEFLNRGLGGSRIVDLYARIKSDIINLKPDILSILIGVNDVWHEIGRHNGVDADKYEIIYDMMIQQIKQALPDIKIMILEPFVLPGSATLPNDEHPDRWEIFSREVPLRARASERIAQKYGLVFVPLQSEFDTLSKNCEMGSWLCDGVHPAPAGHELIKRAWIKAFYENIR